MTASMHLPQNPKRISFLFLETLWYQNHSIFKTQGIYLSDEVLYIRLYFFENQYLLWFSSIYVTFNDIKNIKSQPLFQS